jgi:hypothetical protein
MICHLLGMLSWVAVSGDSVYGTVRDGLTGAPLVGAQVAIVGGDLRTSTNSVGEYSLTTPAPGPQTLTVTRSGYDTVLVEAIIPPGQSLRVDIALNRLPALLPPLEVSAFVKPPLDRDGIHAWSDSAEPGLRRYSAEALRSDPLAVDGDPVLTLGATSGGGVASEFPSTVHVRGGSSDQNLVLLDGIPVYGTMHVGGTASLFDPDAVGTVDLHAAVPPANLGGRLSSAIDVRLRPPGPPGVQLHGGLDRTSLRQTIEARSANGVGALLISGRRSYRGIFAQDLGDGQRSNGFEHFLARASLDFPRDRLALYVLVSADRLGFPATPQGTSTGNVTQPDSGVLNRFDWSTLSAGLVWRHSFGASRTLTTRVWRASATTRGAWAASAGPELLSSELRDLGGSADLVSENVSSRRQVGVAFQRLATVYDVARLPNSGSGPEAALLRLKSSPLILSAFLSEQRRLGTRVILSAGLRANAVEQFGLTLEPRLAGRWTVARHLAVLMGYTRLHQYLQSMRNEESLLDHAFGADLPLGVGAGNLRPARSDQVTTGLEADVGSGVTVRVDAYARWFADLAVVPAATAAPFTDRLVSSGSGQSQGLAIEVAHHGGRFDLRGSMGLGATQRQADTTEFSPGAQRSRWLALGLGYRLGELATFTFAGSLASGSPTSIVSGGLDWQSAGPLAVGGELSGSPQGIVGGLNRSQLPAYLRLDVGLRRDWIVRPLGRAGLLTTSLMVTNLLNRPNVLGYSTDPVNGSRRSLLFPPRSLNLQLAWHF